MNTKYTKKFLDEAVKDCESWASVCRKIGIKPFTGAQTHLSKTAKKLGVDTSHFKGHAWNKGKPARNKKDISEYLKKNVSISSSRLKNKLIEENIFQKKCYICNLIEWNNQSIPLELHHKDNDHFNNLLSNLIILCPNCHALEH